MWILIIVKVSLRGGTLALPDANLALLNGAKNNNDTVFNPRGRRQRPSATSWRPSSSTPPRETATCITVSARLPMSPTSTLRSHVWPSNTCVCTKAGTSFGRLLGCDQSRSSAGTWRQESNWPDRRMVSSHCPLLIRRKHETWRFRRLSSSVLWKAPWLWITLPEDGRHHRASLKSRLKKTHFYHAGFYDFIRLCANLWTCICINSFNLSQVDFCGFLSRLSTFFFSLYLVQYLNWSHFWGNLFAAQCANEAWWKS